LFDVAWQPNLKLFLCITAAVTGSLRRAAMKARKTGVEIQRFDEKRFSVVVDEIVRYVGPLHECQRRAAIFAPKESDRGTQDRALGRLGRSR
jgi:hypothetical protein